MDNNELRDRRRTRRHDINVPLKYRLWKSQMPEKRAEALNISENGVYFATHSMIQEGETVEVRFEMPEAVVDEPSAEWRCTGRVVRVEQICGAGGKLAVGVRFDCYEIVKPHGTTTVQVGVPVFRAGYFSPGRTT